MEEWRAGAGAGAAGLAGAAVGRRGAAPPRWRGMLIDVWEVVVVLVVVGDGRE